MFSEPCRLLLLRRSRSSPAEQLPRVADGTVYEVQPVGESIVYTVEHRRMLVWANRVTEQQWQRLKDRRSKAISA